MKDEKILKKVAKLLKLYGVEEEEKINGFLDDLKEMKDDEEVKEEGEKLEEPTENEEATEEITETEEVEENPAEPEQPQEEVAKESEETEVEEEKPAEEEGETETTATDDYDYKEKYEEVVKTLETLSSRLESLENVVSKLGVPQDETLGASPNSTPVDEQPNDSFNNFVSKRIGK